MKAEKLGQLRAGQKEGDSAFEAGHHAFGNEVYNDACFDEPGEERDECNKQSGSGSECAKARRITTRDLAKGRTNEQRYRRSDSDNSVPRTTKQPEDESTEQTRVKSSLGRQIGQRRVSQTGGKQICGERNSGENIRPQPASLVGTQPTESRNQSSERWCIHGGNCRRSGTAALTTPVFPMADLVLLGPGASCLQRVAMLLALDPSLKSLFINRQVENTRRAEQFPKRLHYLRRG